MAWSNDGTGWNSETNTWSNPTGGNWQAPAWNDVWSAFLKDNPGAENDTGQNKKKKFTNWWQITGSGMIAGAWNAGNTAWDTVWSAWNTDPDRMAQFTSPADLVRPTTSSYFGEVPLAPDNSDILDWQTAQLYGADVDDPNTPQDETQGIYDAVEALATELSAGSAQYNDEWLAQYAEQAGFTDPEARQAFLEAARAALIAYQAERDKYVTDSTSITPEQQKMIRQQQAEQEAKARKQAETMYQETGSYAALQRASDELNRSSVDQAVKLQMEMALQNFAAAQSAVNQQTDLIFREVEAGNASFRDYVNAKQTGLNAAMNMWQQRASQVMDEANQKMAAAQATFDNAMKTYNAGVERYGQDMATYQWEYDQAKDEFYRVQDLINTYGQAIKDAQVIAMGYTKLLEATNAYWDAYVAPMISQWEDEIVTEEDNFVTGSSGGDLSVFISAIAIAIGFILLFTPLAGLGGTLLAGGITNATGVLNPG